jgi:PAS domain S-box-containing protein
MVGGEDERRGARGVLAATQMGQALLASERRFQALAEVSIQGKLVHHRFRPLFANDAFALLCGCADGADVVARPNVLAFLDEDTRADPGRAWDIALRGPFAGRRLFRRADGALYPAEIYGRPIEWDGQAAIALAVLDVSEEEQAQRALRRALVQAETARTWRQSFVDAARRELDGPAATLRERLDALIAKAAQSPGLLRPITRRPAVLGGLEVLSVDSDPQHRALSKLALAGLSHRPMVAESTTEALDLLKRRPFHVVLIDIGPDSDGLFLARAIRNLPGARAGTPIVALGASTQALREDATEAGVDALLDKPLELPQLAETLRLLAGARSVDPALGDQIQDEDNDEKPNDQTSRTQGHRRAP